MVYIFAPWKRTSNVWIRAIIKTIQASNKITKYIQKQASDELIGT
jgi:hypothetical protein